MKILSLFDGISCGRVAFERAGISIEKYYASEILDEAITISKRNYPDIIHVGDVRLLDPNDFMDVDMIIGGSPCQNFSFAGTRKGATTVDNIEVTSLEQYLELKEQGYEFKGESYLFWEYVRLLRAIKPKYFLLENVRMSSKWKDVITEAVGVQPIAINSQLVSAQNRPRLYWTNIPGVTQPKDKGILLGDVLKDTYTEEEELTEAMRSRFRLVEGKSYCGTTMPESGGYLDPNRVYGDMNKCACLTAHDFKQVRKVYHNGVVREMSPEEAELIQTLPEGYTKGVPTRFRFFHIGNGWTVDVISHIFSFLKNE